MMKTDCPAIEFEKAEKKYAVNKILGKKEITAFTDLSFSLAAGSATVLLGLNGAGKTTILKLIAGLLFPSAGRISVFGHSPHSPETKADIGFLPELPYFPPYEKPMDVLRFYGSLSGIPNKDLDEAALKALEITGLSPHKDKKIYEFSKGMMQRLGLAQAMQHNPKILLLDEPVSGLDPIAIRDIRHILLEMSKKGTTILMSSHSISEAEKICGQAMIMKDGMLSRTIQKNEWEQEGGLEEVFINILDKKHEIMRKNED